ncbi:hypothetical protein LCGC14_3005160 [marine sediment metagenome]|uniref:Uncharacterized protein n=1 Tax=marine sediment metagenome TaxID=412755 RepID=A0A0F8ZR38_9ZZZZ
MKKKPILLLKKMQPPVKKLKENARLYFGEDKPLLLIKQEGLNKGINLSCLVMPYLHRN